MRTQTLAVRSVFLALLAVAEVVGTRQGGVDVGAVGQRPRERRE